jgi:O-antigen ligase
MKADVAVAENTGVRSAQPVSQLVVSWVLMIPLMYYAGGFWVRNARGNNELGSFGSLANAPQTAEDLVTPAVVLAIVLVLLFPKLRAVVHDCANQVVFAALAALSVLSCLWSQSPFSSLEYSVSLAINTCFAFYLYRRFDPERLKRLLLMLGWICLLLSIILALFFPQYGVSGSIHAGAWQGVYIQKNGCSEMTVLLLSVAFFIPSVTLLSRLSRAVYICLSAFLILMTQSATGKIALASLLAFVIAMQMIKRFSSKDRIAVGLLGVTIGSALFVAGSFYWIEIATLLGKDPTLSGRTGIWKEAMSSVMKHPFLGYGYHAFWEGLQGESANVVLASHWAVSGAHNGCLELWLELGMAGLGLFLYSAVRAFRDTLFCLRGGKSPHFAWYACVVFLIIVMSIDESIGIAAANNLAWIMFIVACIGLSAEARRIRSAAYHG